MNTYHKIQTIYKRDKKGKIILSDYSKPEFAMLKDILWIAQEKIDGMNLRIIWKNKQLSFKGKTDKAQLPKHLLDKLQKIFTIDKMNKVFSNKDVCLYGEGYGHKIQKAGEHYLGKKVDFILFDIKIGHWWLTWDTVKSIARSLEIKHVPCIGTTNLDNAINFVRKGFTSKIAEDKNFIAEGLILKPMHELFNRNRERIITKIKHKDFKNL